jgi:membrane-associated phospholipid phosphatase
MASLNAIDRLTVAYLLFTLVLIALGSDRILHATSLAALNAALLALVWGLARARTQGHGVLTAVAEWYPLGFFVIFFEQIGSLVHALVEGWCDPLLIAADHALFGVHPTVWIEQFSSYWLTEYMQFSYAMYFPLTAGVAVWLRFRHGREALFLLMLASCITYYTCYVLFVLFPVESPFHTLRHLQTVELHGGPFTALIAWIERHGRVHGGAFPSAHVAGSIVTLLAAWQYSARVGKWLAPIVASIMISTVYGRYHYVVDVPAGAIVAVLGYGAALRMARRDLGARSPW